MSPPDMRDYTVVFVQGDLPVGGERRTAVHAKAAETGSRAEALRAFITEAGLAPELGGFGEPTPFGMVAMRATPVLAACVQRIAGVEAVIAD